MHIFLPPVAPNNILTAEVKSLFSVVMYGIGVTDDCIYLKYLINLLREYMNGTENRLIFERVIATKTGAVTMSKIASRSVLGSMNDMVNLCEMCIQLKGPSPWD